MDELTIYYTLGRRLTRIITPTGTSTLDLPSGVYPDSVVIIEPRTNTIVSYVSTDSKSKQITIKLPQAHVRISSPQGEIQGLLQDISPDNATVRTSKGVVVVPNYTAVNIIERIQNQSLDTSYLLRDLSWSAIYTILLDTAKSVFKVVNIKADISNDTGYDFNLSQLKIVTGHIKSPRPVMEYMQARAQSLIPIESKVVSDVTPNLPRDYYAYELGPRKLSRQLRTDILELTDVQAYKMYYHTLDDNNHKVTVGYEADLSPYAPAGITLPQGTLSIYEYTHSLGDFLGTMNVREQSIKSPFRFKLGTTPLVTVDTRISTTKHREQTSEQKGPNIITVQIHANVNNHAEQTIILAFTLPDIVMTGTITERSCDITRVIDGELQVVREVPTGKSEFTCRMVITQ